MKTETLERQENIMNEEWKLQKAEEWLEELFYKKLIDTQIYELLILRYRKRYAG